MNETAIGKPARFGGAMVQPQQIRPIRPGDQIAATGIGEQMFARKMCSNVIQIGRQPVWAPLFERRASVILDEVDDAMERVSLARTVPLEMAP